MTLPPIRRSVVVDATPERAYAAWTDEIARWWPLATHSVFKHDNHVAFVDGDLVETATDGRRTVWGTVLEADPPRLLRLSWHPGNEDERGTVEVRFVRLGQHRTLVTLTHTGWEHYPRPESAREDYHGGWAIVQETYRKGAGAAPALPGDAEVWLILEHTLGAAAGAAGAFTHPLFAEHRAFVESLAADGVLVAAGPLPDVPGAGQTILRVPESSAADYIARAQQDGSVAGDLFVLNVRPWQVVATGPAL